MPLRLLKLISEVLHLTFSYINVFINLFTSSSVFSLFIFFLKQEEIKTLIIKQVDEEIGSFYLLVIRNLAKLNNLKLDFNQKMDVSNDPISLFGDEKLDIFTLTSKASLDKIIVNKNKKIIFTDYKAFKKYQKLMECVNGYNYISDIKYYLEKILDIKESELINYCQSTPSLTYSETSKFLINKENYSKETGIFETTNFIVKIRKAIFNSKSSGDIRKSFLNLKEEVKYKKFSFLTY